MVDSAIEYNMKTLPLGIYCYCPLIYKLLDGNTVTLACLNF